jgi:hypothetical protein
VPNSAGKFAVWPTSVKLRTAKLLSSTILALVVQLLSQLIRNTRKAIKRTSDQDKALILTFSKNWRLKDQDFEKFVIV